MSVLEETATGDAAAFSVPPTMRAIIQTEYGAPSEQLHFGLTATPTPAPNQVLIDVTAAGIDRGVWHLTTGLPFLVRLAGYGVTKPKMPVPGMDVSGVVVAVGSEVTRFDVGDDVFGIARGSLAEYAVADESKIVKRPLHFDPVEAATVAVSGITALQAVSDVAGTGAGESVLVLGASGGVGSYAVQIAKALGADVTGVASASKAEMVRDLGADRVVDYRSQDPLAPNSYDVIIDTGGLNPVRRLRKALRPGGRLVIVGGEGKGRWTGGVGRQLRAALLSPFVSQRLTGLMSKERSESIERLAEMIAAGDVTPAVGSRYPLAEAANAITDLENGLAKGKSVVVV